MPMPMVPGSTVIKDALCLCGDFSNIFRFNYRTGIPRSLSKSQFARSQWTYHMGTMRSTGRWFSAQGLQ